MTDRARVVVIGGGVAGCSVALHLARAGWTDLLLFDKGELTSGSTAHAAGLVTMFNPSPTMAAFRRYSIELYGELGVFDTVGSLRIASSRESLEDLRRGVSRANGIGLEVELLSPDETLRLMPAASPESLFGSVWVPADGFLDPHTATYALADAARSLGARIRTNERVTAIELDERRTVRAVRTERDRVECEVVVDAGGIWAPRVASMAGVRIPSTPVDHQHVALKAVPGSELPRDMPCFRDPDRLVYGKVGGRRDRVRGVRAGSGRSMDRRRALGARRALAHSRHGAVRAAAARGSPAVPVHRRRRDREARLSSGRDDPGREPARRPGADRPRPVVRRRNVIEWLRSRRGARPRPGRMDSRRTTRASTSPRYRPWRFGRVHDDAGWVAELARETYRYYYRLRYPFDHDEWGRPKRLSPLHGRLQDAGAVFQAKHGWERPERFEPGRPWRRAGADQRTFGWERPPWLDRVGDEHRAVRERAGLFDLSSFGKVEVIGPDAVRLLERAAANRVDVAPGRVVYTQFLDAKGGIVADVTVTRLADDRFRVTTGAATVDGDLGWLRRVAMDEGLDRVGMRDASEELAVIAVWGRSALDVLGACADMDASTLPPMTGREVRIGPVAVWAQAVSFAGEPGWELAIRPEDAVQVWDRLVDAGGSAGLEPCGYRCLDGLRIEKGFRYLGTDLTADDTPMEAGLERFVAFEGRDFIGRQRLLQRRDAGIERRLRTLLIGDDDSYLRLYGGEAVQRGGRAIGRVRSASYAFTVGRNVGLAYLPTDLGPTDVVQVEVFGRAVPATVGEDVLVSARSRA